MGDLLVWYLAVLILGVACLPLTTTIFRPLPDRGWSMTKPFAILMLGVMCWLPPVVIHVLPYSRGWIALVALLLIASNVALVTREPQRGRDLLAFVRRRWGYVFGNEAIFAAGLALMGWLRSYYPKVEGTEKFMDQAFISAIMRTQHLPPPDPWFAGQPINYYYLGHFLIATLAKLLGTVPNVAFNTGVALTAGLAAVTIAGIASNIIAIIFANRKASTADLPEEATAEPDLAETRLALALPFGVVAVLLALVVGNLRSFTIWWGDLPHQTLGAAFAWLGHSAGWATYDWWSPSRALPGGVITEFPSFSFLLADLHAHLMALPYAMLGLGVALTFWRLPLARGWAALGEGWERWARLSAAGVALGGLYMINGWDLPTYVGITLLAIALHQWRAHDRILSPELALAIAWIGGAVVAACLIPYLPFWLTFSSPGQGIGIVPGASDHLAPLFTTLANPPAIALGSRSAITDEVAIFGLPLFILGSWLLVLSARNVVRFLPVFVAPTVSEPATSITLGPDGGSHLTLVRSGPSNQNLMDPDKQSVTLAASDTTSNTWVRAWGIVLIIAATAAWITWSTARWDAWTLLWCLALVGLCIWLILYALHRDEATIVFPLLLTLAAFGLVGICEVVFLKDVFVNYSPRMNTIFKFYFQAWTLLAIAAAAALAWIGMHLAQRLPVALRQWEPVAFLWRWIWGLALLVLFAMASIFPLGASHAIYLDRSPSSGTLVGLTPGALTVGDVEAINWLNANVSGSPVIVEANSAQADYSATYARVSTFTGLPTIMGWQGHEDQWRVNWVNTPAHAADFVSRFGDIQTIYTSTNREQVTQLLRHYHVTYLYVGAVEAQTYGPQLQSALWRTWFSIAYQRDGVTIYQVTTAATGD